MAWLLIAVSTLLMLAGVLCWLGARYQVARATETSLTSGDTETASTERYHQLVESRLMREGRGVWRKQARSRPWMAELALLLRQAGFVGSRAQLYVLLANLVVVIGVYVGSVCYGIQAGEGWLQAGMTGVGYATLAVVAEWLWLKSYLHRRVQRLDEEIETVVQVTRMLWDSGMTLEGVLRGLVVNLNSVTPECIREMRLVLQRIDSGQSREEVLEASAGIQRSEGLQDLFRLLSQVSTTGGGARASLLDLAALLRDRRRTRLQETVTKLSAKMSLVMMLFLFPALLIVLAGPAVVNLGDLFNALGG